jgi:cytoskeletal protein CcmA (bactofilin family)
MFSKTPATDKLVGLSSDLAVQSADKAGSSPAAVRRSPKVASLIADDITIEGNLRGDGELQVDGVIQGDVAVARLTIGEGGKIDGSVQADSAEVRGRVVGSITAKQVRLYASAHVDGDITHEQLTMEAGAFFQGRSLRFQRAAAVAPLASGDVIDITAASSASS